jgi:protein-disulfide isomerase
LTELAPSAKVNAMKQPLSMLALVAALAIGCARSAEVETLQQRVERLETQSPQVVKLEQRVASLEAAARRIEALAGALDAGPSTEARVASGDMDSRLEALARKLDELERRVVGPPAPSPGAIYSVPVGSSPFRGPRDARVTIIRGYEFACPYCERSRATMDQLLNDYGSDLRIVYKPLIVHPQVATDPALAACAAHMQGRFFDMEPAIWARGYLANRDLSAANMEKIAQDLGLDMERFRKDMKGAACSQEIRADQALLRRVGAGGTPSFYVNGRFISGARPIEMFKTVIDEELARADRVMKEKKIKKRDYYDHVVKIGKQSL